MSLLPVYVFSPVSYEDWDWRSPWNPGIGGSETSHCEMVSRLAKRGHKVISVAPVPPESHAIVHDGVEWLDVRRMTLPQTPAWVVNYRNPSLFNQPKPAGQKWIYMSEDVDAGGWTAEALARLDRYLCLCQTHVDFTHNRYPMLKDRIFTSANGVRADYIEALEPLPRDPHRLLYASSPDRGLLILLRNWFRISERFPKATLRIAYGFDNMLKVIAQAAPGHPLAAMKHDLDGLLNQPGVIWLGRIGQAELYREWQQASAMPYPSAWPETNNIAIQDAMACGCIPVTTNYWAQGQWAKESPLAYLVDGLPEKSTLVMTHWLDLLYEVLERAEAGEYDQTGKFCCTPNITHDYIPIEELDSGECETCLAPLRTPRENLSHWALNQFDYEIVVDQWDGWIRADSGEKLSAETTAVETVSPEADAILAVTERHAENLPRIERDVKWRAFSREVAKIGGSLPEKLITPQPDPEAVQLPTQFNVPAIHREFKGTAESADELDILFEIYEAKIYDPLLEFVVPGKRVHFLDFGCHVGHFTRWFTRELEARGCSWQGSLVDGNPKTLEIAKTRLADLDNLKFTNGVVGPKHMTSIMRCTSKYPATDSIFPMPNLEDVVCIGVPTATPCDLIHSDRELYPDYYIAKVDIEGSEYELVANWRVFLKTYCKAVIFEVRGLRGDNKKLRNQMKALGFSHRITASRDLTTMELFWKCEEKQNGTTN